MWFAESDEMKDWDDREKDIVMIEIDIENRNDAIALSMDWQRIS